MGDESIIEDPKASSQNAENADASKDLTFAEAVERLRLPKNADQGGKKGAGGSTTNKKKDIKFTPE